MIKNEENSKIVATLYYTGIAEIKRTLFKVYNKKLLYGKHSMHVGHNLQNVVQKRKVVLSIVLKN